MVSDQAARLFGGAGSSDPEHQPGALAPPAPKRGLHLRRFQRKLRSDDPQRAAILARIGAVWRHRPRSGVLVFFDEQPIAVKAYGGRRYTSAQSLEIPRNRKTRGFFQLFGLYEVNHGRVRWRFRRKKNSPAVASFMRQVRRWYPAQEVWVILDQDSTHPRKSRLTRRVMRQLHLHWISLPKRSPNDNPLETLFSDVQQMVLDASDDPDARTTQKRISAHWRRRNRQKDRFIHISYLGCDSHKL